MTNADTFLTDGFAPFQTSMILVTMGQYPNEKRHRFNGCHNNETNIQTQTETLHTSQIIRGKFSYIRYNIHKYIIYIYIYTQHDYISLYLVDANYMQSKYVEWFKALIHIHEISAVRSNNGIIPMQFISCSQISTVPMLWSV